MKTLRVIFPLIIACILGLTSCGTEADRPSDAASNSSKTASDGVQCKHDFGQWDTVLEPTCGATGKRMRECSLCHLKEQRTLPANGEHVYIEPGKCKICSAVMNPDFIFELNSDKSSYSFRYKGKGSAVTVPESYNGLPVTRLSDGAFWLCYELKTVQLPDSIISIGNGAFNACRNLSSVNTPKNLTTIGKEAFAGCVSLSSFHIPDSVTRIEHYAFSSCGLKSVELPETLTYIGERAFADCCEFTTLKIPASVTEMGEYAFSGCRALRNIEIESNTRLTAIPVGAFSSGASLTKVVVGEGIETLEKNCFGSHPLLASVTLPSTVKRIGEQAFHSSAMPLNILYNGSSSAWSRVELGEKWTTNEVETYITFLK